MNKLALPLAVVLASCTAHTAARGSAGQGAPRACDPAAVVPGSLLGSGTFLLFGEFHGTAELPAFFGEAVCQVSGSRPVLVGLEVPGSELNRVTTYLDSAGAPPDRAALLIGSFWTSPVQDGRRSMAMLGLIERLRVLRKAGAAVQVTLFDVEEAEAGPDRDERMARNLAAAARAHPGATVLAHMGNYHARTVAGAPWDPKARFLGWHLARGGLEVKALDFAAPAGTAWTCMMEAPGRPPVCGPTSMGATNPFPGKAGITPFAKRSPEGFDGTFAVTTRTASPPAATR